MVIVDRWPRLDIETDPYQIPGARWIPPERLRDPNKLMRTGNEIVFYCAEPREAMSARMARMASFHGYKNLAKRDWKERRFSRVPGDEVEFVPVPDS